MKRIIITLLCLFMLNTAFANGVHLKKGHPVRYTVKPGDTLWGIAGKFLDNPVEWPLLLKSNPQLKKPYHLYPGEVLVLHSVNGRPELFIEGGGTVVLSPKIREEKIDNAIPTIPIEYVKPFLTGTRVVNREELLYAPYIVAHEGEHAVAGAGDSIFAVGITDKTATDFSIFRPGPPYVDPQTKELLGYQATDIGEARLAHRGNPAALLITRAPKEVLNGDRLLPFADSQIIADFNPRIPTDPIKGQIISVLGGVTQIGQYNVVVIDRGTANSLQIGDLLAVYQLGATIRDPVGKSNRGIRLPNVKAGEILIFRTFRRVSYGLIMHATMPIHILDVVTNPNKGKYINQSQLDGDETVQQAPMLHDFK